MRHAVRANGGGTTMRLFLALVLQEDGGFLYPAITFLALLDER